MAGILRFFFGVFWNVQRWLILSTEWHTLTSLLLGWYKQGGNLRMWARQVSELGSFIPATPYYPPHLRRDFSGMAAQESRRPVRWPRRSKRKTSNGRSGPGRRWILSRWRQGELLVELGIGSCYPGVTDFLVDFEWLKMGKTREWPWVIVGGDTTWFVGECSNVFKPITCYNAGGKRWFVICYNHIQLQL